MSTAIADVMSEEKRKITITRTISSYGRQLFSFILQKVKKTEDAEDILQDVWYQFSRLDNIEELNSISGWLYSITKNKITDLRRKKKTDNLEDHTFSNDDGDRIIKGILLTDESSHPELKIYKDLFWKELTAALNELPENQKQVFILNEMEDKTLQEIADANGEKLKTIISRKGYAVKHLRKRLEPFYKEINL